MPAPLPPPPHRGGSVVGVALLGVLLVLAVLGTALLATMPYAPGSAARFAPGQIVSTTCPDAGNPKKANSEETTCAELQVENLGATDGTALCHITNDAAGATVRFADNGVFSHVIDVTAGSTATLPLTVVGDPVGIDRLSADCATAN